MIDVILPIVFVTLCWWISTGAVLWLAGGKTINLHKRLIGLTVLSAFGFLGTIASSNSTAQWTPYVGFVSALTVWAWIEFTFLTGMITGPLNAPCPPNITEKRRFRLAFRTIMHHEFVLLGALIAIYVISVAGANLIAFYTFGLLWLMRLSAKLTIFSGAPTLSLDMMPHRLSHMTTYFRVDRIGPVFWVSCATNCILLTGAIWCLANQQFAPHQFIGLVMLTTLVALAVLEHLFMVLPVRESVLWEWAMTKNEDQNPAATAAK